MFIRLFYPFSGVLSRFEFSSFQENPLVHGIGRQARSLSIPILPGMITT
ncbi:hypothetical protein [Akkermansia sp.]|jgi:hypothetical protein